MTRLISPARLAACALATVALIAFFLPGCEPSHKKAGPREKVTIACAEHLSTALVQVAYAKGYFSDEGVDVVLQRHAVGKMALESMLQGKADLATVADTPIMLAVMHGKKFYILADIETANKNMTIIGLKDKGIIKPADLKGKKIGVTFGTNADYFLEIFLMANGIDRRSTSIIDLKPDAMLDALRSGAVDVVSTWNPNVHIILDALGARCSVFYGDMLYTETFCLTADQEFVRKHPQTVEKVLHALVKAEKFINNNGADSIRIAGQFMKKDEDHIARMWDIFHFRVTLDQSLIVSLENQTRWAIRNRLSSGAMAPNYIDFIYSDGLKSIKPEAVIMIQ